MPRTSRFLLAFLLLGPPLAGQDIDRAIDLHTAGRLEEALREYHAVAAATGESDPAVAGTALNNACLILMDLGDYRLALPDCRKALALVRAAGDRETISHTLNNLGLALQVVGKPDEAEKSFREALAINREIGDAEAQAINLSNLGALALAAGHYSAALTLYAEAEAVASQHPEEPWAAEQIRVARLNQGVVF